ncbi:sugar ABC transporter ATP-binding protein [Hujiaoplasma nucleasis]|uniref:Sugar ABC transporter ATP-binding protein n=1 Tax=Hujiaoplasma nucleasis TaxID=2725268 RepID=A0A7L6N4X2_9MOLU|nr:sugar ABC transporter ATP-binding protein [Hujiaoplasma nucleasis]QLY39554.1 sugar ABC transporter ATP-binding protein [Hujiaoplasma nucleasis]
MVVEFQNIYKNFNAVKALENVSFKIGDSEIHGLLGENGAGKSTLMNILGGVLPPTSGKIVIDGVEYAHLTPVLASELGINFIHQELNLVNDLKVYENLFIHREITKHKIFLDKKTMIKKSYEIFNRLNIDINPTVFVSQLDTLQKQLVEIARAILFESKLIIMDEPTTALTNKEIDNLFNIMRDLKKNGISCIYISHKMPELFAICDRYTVLRNGKFIASGDFKDIDEDKATELLVGRSIVEDKDIHREQLNTETVLQVIELTSEPYFRDISFEVKKGEVIVITGLFGDGRGELSEALFGARDINKGKILKNGIELPIQSIKKMMRSGVGMIPRDRKERSIIKDMNILNNVSMAHFNSDHKSLLISDKEEIDRFKKNQEITNIKVGSPKDSITSLSGGNQQKVIFARWFELDSDVYILDNPTQGIDVGAKFEIYKLIDELSKKGKAIIVFSSEFPEIYKIAHRCIVMYKGSINKILNHDELTERDVMYYSTGSNRKES